MFGLLNICYLYQVCIKQKDKLNKLTKRIKYNTLNNKQNWQKAVYISANENI